ncbi:MAG: response regulator [Gammaproteobacteria bacterium]|nr:response regulator [Gammaproteobacteria bacterium]
MDPNRTRRRAATLVLKSAGFEIAAVDDLRAAIAELQRRPIEMILLDDTFIAQAPDLLAVATSPTALIIFSNMSVHQAKTLFDRSSIALIPHPIRIADYVAYAAMAISLRQAADVGMIDPTVAMELLCVAGKHRQASAVVARFGDEALALMSDLQHALSCQDDAGMRAAMHKLKGAAGGVGALQFMQEVDNMERAMQDSAPSIGHLHALLEMSCAALNNAALAAYG